MAALGLALIMTFSVLLIGSRGPWGSFWALFAVLFLALWVSGIYIQPFGPVLWGVAWLPMIVSAVVFTIILLAIAPIVGTTRRTKDGRLRNQEKERDPNYKPARQDNPSADRFGGTFFWMLIVLFSIAILAHSS